MENPKEDLVKVLMFKALKNTNRFKKNQTVWIQQHRGTHAYIIYKFRGRHRYVKGIIQVEFDTSIISKPMMEIKVERSFAEKHNLQIF